MVGVPAFSVMWRSMPSLRIGWPRPCLASHPADEARAHCGDHQQRRDDRHAAAEGDVAQQIEDRDVVVVLGQPQVEQVEHQPSSRGAARSTRAATRRWPWTHGTLSPSPRRRAASAAPISSISAPASGASLLGESDRESVDRDLSSAAPRRTRRRLGRPRSRSPDPLCAGPASGPSSSMSVSTAMRRPAARRAPSARRAEATDTGLAL